MAISVAINKPFQSAKDFLKTELLKQHFGLCKLKVGPLPSWRFKSFKTFEILLEAADFHPINAEQIREFYLGNFALGGRMVQAGGASPFSLHPPTLEFAEALHDFSWLRDLRGAKTPLSATFARAMVQEWLDSCNYKAGTTPWRPDIVARRLIACLSHCRMLVEGASGKFIKKFLKSLSFQFRYLYISAKTMPENERKLQTYIGLCFAAISLNIDEKKRQYIYKQLSNCLDKQIYPDGGHISRNPTVLINLLFDLLSIRYSFNYMGQAAPIAIHNAIERMIPALRMFCHQDGSIARFNGVGAILPEKLSSIFALDEAQGEAFSYAPYSGYQRLHAETTTIIADIGKAPPFYASYNSGAGCLSFEMSSGKHSFIVNAGLDYFAKNEHKHLGRLSAAHSTATISNSSACDFISLDQKNNELVINGNFNVSSEQIKGPQQIGFIASHDGYKKKCNLLHERKLTLTLDGNVIQGMDRFFTAGVKDACLKGSDQITLRFHLHPDIELSYSPMGNICLQAKQGDVWQFSCSNIDAEIEDSIYFASLKGAQATKQIVLTFRPSLLTKIHWLFQRTYSAS
ncbi:heparinase II/III family protein [Bartonella sp. TP]|uniref:heparinase II/III family protein n=1 Tax=Bartonella sp. TP TaxID=3057550 RepID=UPI0025B22406|nr:heparinase II/III family protein [Bartonella sp. TP]WJW79565.1 heparinase II/III family protein [Bartonella sp. TP]